MEGTHILANEQLTKDIMTKVKGQDLFPTMFIIKKDGAIERSKTQYPINESVLINQLDTDLKE